MLTNLQKAVKYGSAIIAGFILGVTTGLLNFIWSTAVLSLFLSPHVALGVGITIGMGTFYEFFKFGFQASNYYHEKYIENHPDPIRPDFYRDIDHLRQSIRRLLMPNQPTQQREPARIISSTAALQAPLTSSRTTQDEALLPAPQPLRAAQQRPQPRQHHSWRDYLCIWKSRSAQVEIEMDDLSSTPQPTSSSYRT